MSTLRHCDLSKTLDPQGLQGSKAKSELCVVSFDFAALEAAGGGQMATGSGIFRALIRHRNRRNRSSLFGRAELLALQLFSVRL